MHIALTKLLPTDRETVIQHLQDPDIAASTVGIPWPYSGEDFASMLAKAEAEELGLGHPTYLAIRDANGSLIGAIRFQQVIGEGVLELGYWLAKPWWGQGTMTKAVRAACDHAFIAWDVGVIFASVIESNVASQRVLEKSGFTYDGPTVLLKDGQDVAGRVYIQEDRPF